MADSRRSAGGVAPRSRPRRVTPYGPSKVSHRRSIQYDPPAISPSGVPPRRGTKGVSTQYDPPATGPSKVFPSLRPEIGPSNVPLRSNIQYHPPRPAIGPEFSPLLRPAMDLSKVPPCLHYLYPYGLAFRFLAGLPASTPYDVPAIGPSYVTATPYDLPANPYEPPTTGTPCDPPAIGCHSTPPHDSPAIGCLNNPCDSPASSPSCLNNTPSPVSDSDSEITLDYDGRRCFICDGKRLHSSVRCPCLVLAAQLDVVKDNPPKEWEYYRYVVRNEWEGMDGYGVGFYDPPKKGDVERSAADAMRQYKDGMNMIRMTGLPENNRDPERLCRQLEKKFGAVAHAIVFPDQSFGFVKFVNRDSAKKAIEVLNNYSDWEGMDGYGVGFYDPPKKEDVERSAADAMRQYKDGMNMIRMTGLPENNKDPERLCRQLEKKFGAVAHAVVFPDQSFGFVKFVNRDSAKKAIEVLNNYSDCGHLMWAMQSPE